MSKLSNSWDDPGGGDSFLYDEDPFTHGADDWEDEDDEISQNISSVAARQSEMAKQQWEMYKEFFLPYEIESAKANRELLPLILEASKTTLALQPGATKELYRQALEGVDVEKRMDEAGAEVVGATKLGEGMRRREISRYGIDPGSTTYGDVANKAALATAKNVAGARTKAKTDAEEEKFRRLGYVLGKGVYQTQVGQQADPYGRASQSTRDMASTYASLANRVLGGDDYNRQGSLIGGAIGAGAGAYFGGPQGAMAGYNIGSGLGGAT